ncbi:MAG: TetR/AcrR family transcriptional regulator [Gemmatimonadetes bacterium]|nr:TetR/AcrR family transcriptional regulator [Gemmatimonadota bacterium]
MMSQRDPTTPQKRRDGAATRERLMRAAVELFTTQGYHASTTPVIAAKAGIAEGTIYRHFPSKQQLLNDVYRSSVGLFTRLLREAPRDVPCRTRLETVAAAWRDLAAREPAIVRLVFVARVRNLLDQKSRDAWSELRSELETVIATGKAAGHVRPGPVDLWADIWLQLVALMLERVANKDWAPENSAPAQVVESAWVVMKADG